VQQAFPSLAQPATLVDALKEFNDAEQEINQKETLRERGIFSSKHKHLRSIQRQVRTIKMPTDQNEEESPELRVESATE
jgi:hypothetical protein